MHQPIYNIEFRRYLVSLIDHQNHLKKNDSNYQESTLKSKEFTAILNFAKKQFIWQEGKYEVQLELRIAGVKMPTIQTFHFEIEEIDIESLQQNLLEIERYLGDLIRPPQLPTRYNWNWVYPLFPSDRS